MLKKLLLGFLLLAMQQASAQVQTLTPELLWKLGRVSLEDVSSDGNHILYGVTRYELATNKGTTTLYATAIDKPISQEIAVDVDNIKYDGAAQKIAYLKDGLLHETNLDGSNPQRMSDLEMNGFAISPDGKKVLYIQDIKYFNDVKDVYPDLPLAKGRIIDDLMYRHWKSWDDYKRSNIFVANIDNGRVVGEPRNIMKDEPFDAPLSPLGGMEQIAWSADSKSIAYTCKKKNGKADALSTNSDIFVFDLETGTTTNLSEGMMGYDQEPAYSPNGRYIAWNSMEHDGYESDKNRIFVYDLVTKLRFDLTKSFDNNADHPTWSSDSQTIFALSGNNATEQIFAFDVASRKSRQVTSGIWDFQSLKVLDNNTLVGGRVSMSSPAELYSVNAQNGVCTQLSQINDALWGTVKKGEVRKRMVKTSDGKQMQVWVIYPPDFDATKKYPALLYCQGGPQSMVSQFFSYRWNFQLMANNGYIVIAPCRRGMPGFGTAWNEAISGNWGGQAQTDLLSAIDDVRKESYIDNKKIGCVGASYGGYSAYWLAGNHNKRFSCFISHCGLFNLESWYGTTEELWFANKDIGGAYWQKPQPKNYVSYNPKNFVGNWDSPRLVIHSENDFRVPIGEGIQAFQAAQLRNIPSRFLYLPEEGHWVGAPQTSVLWQRVFYDWLDRYLKK